MSYKLIDHTADFGIHVFGPDLKALFKNAARAMFDQIVSTRDLQGGKISRIRVEGADYPDLMVNWLRELLFMWSTDQMIPSRVEILSISETELDARLEYDQYDPAIHVLKSEIKAVTYHQIQVLRSSDSWEAKVIFDI